MTSFYQNRSVLVTGAAGFIGSHLVEELAKRGAIVKAFVRYNSRGDIGLLSYLEDEVLNRIEIIAGDLRDQATIDFAARGVTHIFHLGALIAIPYSYVNPQEVIETNVMGTLNVLLASREQKVERLIHTSTSEVYGTADYVPIDEIHPLQGQSPYSASKIGADKLVESFYRSYDLPAVTIRPFNTYGPRQSARAVIPTIITQAITQNEIFLGNLETKRDLTFVTDTVNGFLLAGKTENLVGEVINLGTGMEISIRELVDIIKNKIDKELFVRLDQKRLRPVKSEVYRLLSNNKKALQLMNWQPEVDIENGLERTILWIKNNIEKYNSGKYQI